jgi:hypothetical protein
MQCNSCEVLYINGVKTHEIGCPEAYKDTKKICKWCGIAFVPDEKGQLTCSSECSEAYHN